MKENNNNKKNLPASVAKLCTTALPVSPEVATNTRCLRQQTTKTQAATLNTVIMQSLERSHSTGMI